MHDALFADQGRLEDPHLWARAERLGLDVDRFHADRRAPDADDASRRTSAPASAPGVATTPTLFLPDGERISGRPDEDLWRRITAGRGPAA